MARNAVRVGLSLGLMVALLALFLWRVDLSEVGDTVASASLSWLLLATLIALLSYYLRAVRWLLILRPVGGIRHSSAVLATASGYAAMAILPARMGDLVRPLLLAQRDRRPASALLASILTERILDLWTVVAFFLVFVAWPPATGLLPAEAQSTLRLLTRSGVVVGIGLACGTLGLVALLKFQQRFIAAFTAPLARLGPRWQEGTASFLGHFLDGLRALQRPRDLVLTLGTSLVLWYVIYWQVQTTLYAFAIDLPLRASFLLVTLSVIGLAIPTPAGAGGFHKATQIGLTQFFAIDLGKATGVAIVHHAICFLPITLLGLLCLPAFGVSLRQVDRLAAPPGPAAQPGPPSDPASGPAV